MLPILADMDPTPTAVLLFVKNTNQSVSLLKLSFINVKYLITVGYNSAVKLKMMAKDPETPIFPIRANAVARSCKPEQTNSVF